ncbi:MAG TPA: hypothetical protein VGM90_24300 [Kofleriaceae bacterium]|jgi:hypothetical protein
MPTRFSFKPTSAAPTREFVVCDGARTYVVGLDGASGKSAILVVDKGKPVIMKLSVRAAALHAGSTGLMVIGTDLSVHEGSRTLSRVTGSALKQPLVDEFGLLLGTMVAIVGYSEAYALVPMKKTFDVMRWQRSGGWSTVGTVPEIVPRDRAGASIAWDATRKCVVVYGRTAKSAGRIAELENGKWKVYAARTSNGAFDQPCRVLLGGSAIVALPTLGFPHLIRNEGRVFAVNEGPKHDCVGLAGTDLRFVSEEGSSWIIETVPLEPWFESAARVAAFKSKQTAAVAKATAKLKGKATSKTPAVADEVPFKRLQMKLMVVDKLMAMKIIPKFKLSTVEKAAGKKLYDGANWIMPDDDPFGMQPETRDWFMSLPLKREWVAKIKELSWSPGAPTMDNVAPTWDGEDELFYVTAADAADLPLLPNLTAISAVFSPKDETKTVKAFAAKGVELRRAS